MARRFSAKILLASLALVPAATVLPAQAQTVSKPSQELVLSIGNGQLVSVNSPMAEIFVANDNVADVQIKSQRQLYIFGKSGGTTTVYASNARGDIIWSANVRVGANIDSLDQMLNLAMPEAKIGIATMGTNTVLLTGTVAAPEDAAEAERLVEAFVGNGINVISRLKTATPLQVNLRVRIAEVSRNFTRSIGVNLSTVDATGGFRFGIGQGRAPFNQIVPSYIDPATGRRVFPPLAVGNGLSGNGYNLTDQDAAGTTLAGIGRFLGLDLNGALDLAEQDGLLTTLAEPNLTALSGETASFLAGGEFPVITSNGLSGSSVSYKPYGVSLSYTPVVLANGRISIRVKPEVSEIAAVTVVAGTQTASLSTRSAETTVELGSGQSFMIAGLIQNNTTNNIDKAPGLGDVPILGNLFRSSNFRRGETELMIVVTPYLVKPVDDSEIRLPTDGFQVPTEAQRLLGNQFHDGNSNQPRPAPSATGDTAVAAPQVGAVSQAPDATATAQPSQPRRDEKVAAAAPGFSFK